MHDHFSSAVLSIRGTSMDSDLGKSEKEFWLDCNKWSITFLVIESLDGSEILFEINYPSIKEFVIDSH